VPAAYAEPFARYATAISAPGGPLDGNTVRAYLSRLRQFLAWLARSTIEGDPLTCPATRDSAIRDYRAHLSYVAKRKPSTVNGHLTAIDNFYRHLGLGRATSGAGT
jgi:integrase/recombinase XerC